MMFRSKTLVLLICLFLIAFKVAAGSIFIQSAIERAELAGSYNNASASQQAHNSSDSADDKEQVHAMYLIEQILENYENLDQTIKSELPLKRIWTLVDGED